MHSLEGKSHTRTGEYVCIDGNNVGLQEKNHQIIITNANTRPPMDFGAGVYLLQT
jgi:hypothetical protein